MIVGIDFGGDQLDQLWGVIRGVLDCIGRRVCLMEKRAVLVEPPRQVTVPGDRLSDYWRAGILAVLANRGRHKCQSRNPAPKEFACRGTCYWPSAWRARVCGGRMPLHLGSVAFLKRSIDVFSPSHNGVIFFNAF